MKRNKTVLGSIVFAVVLCGASSCKPDAPPTGTPDARETAPPLPLEAGPKPFEREAEEQKKKAEVSLAVKLACARQPHATIDSLAVCIAEGGPKTSEMEGGATSAESHPADAGPPSSQFKRSIDSAGAQYVAAMNAGGEDGGEAARAAYEQALKKAVHDELIRRAAEVEAKKDGGTSSSSGDTSDSGGSPGGGGGSELGKLLTLLLAAGCIAYTGSVAGCAIGAQFVGSILGTLGTGETVDVERARRIADRTTQLEKGTCDSECLAGLYEDSGAKQAIERGAEKELGRLPKETQARIREGFRVFRCVASIDVKGTQAVAAVQKCGIGGPAVQNAARVISNCVDKHADAASRRKACVEEAAKCLVVENNKTIWRCP